MDSLRVVAKDAALVNGTLNLVARLYNSIRGLRHNQEYQEELCRKVKQLEGILRCIETTAHDTNDELMKQALKETHQDLEKCLTVCKEIEQRVLPTKTVKVTGDSRKLEAINSQLVHSLQVLNAHLNTSSYSTNADGRRNLRHLEAVIRNPQAGFYQLDSEDLSVPEKVKKVYVKEVSPGVLKVSWTRVAGARCYEVEYDEENRKYFTYKVKQESQHFVNYECLLDSTKIVFPSKFSYSICICGVNGKGPGEWSACAVGEFTILPSQPRKPLAIHVNSSTSVSLVMEKPPEEEGVKPLTHYVVEYHRLGESEHDDTQEFAIEDLEPLTFQGKSAYKINLEWNIDCSPMPVYLVKISLRNADGVSKVCQDDIRIGTILPSEPVKPVDSDPVVYTDRDTIIIKWNGPQTNAYLLDYYEIHWGRNGNITKIRNTKNCYAVFRELESWQKYHFKVRAVSKTGIKTEFLEINAETDSLAAKLFKTIEYYTPGFYYTNLSLNENLGRYPDDSKDNDLEKVYKNSE